MLFKDRYQAGRLLANALESYKGRQDTLVLGLARGGMLVAFEVAKALNLPLNVVVPRKIGAPGNPELALGSVMENGQGVFNESIIRMLKVPPDYIKREIAREQALACQRLALYREYAPLPAVQHRTVILVDDGIATGSTMLASIDAMCKAEAGRVVVAVPVASEDALQTVEKAADQVICLHSKRDFIGVGLYYENFEQTSNEEVIQLLCHL